MFSCQSISKTRTATSFKQLFASWRLQDASAAQSLDSSPSVSQQLASRAEQAGSMRSLAPRASLQAPGGWRELQQKCFSTSLPPPVLETNIKIHFSPFIAVLKLTCMPDMMNSPPHAIFTTNNVKFYNSFSQWNISWTVSLKTSQMCTNRHVYFELSLKSTGRVGSFSNCEPSPSTFLPIFQT